MPNLNDFGIDENLIHTKDSKYYEIPEFSKLSHDVKDGFSLFHLNIRSLSAHLTELSQLLSCFNFMFDLLGICETKEQIDSGFLANVCLPGYIIRSAPSISSARGVALYIKSSLDYKLREDLKFTNDGFEMIGVEIINSKSKNILCCCVYGQPNSDVQEFTHFINGIRQTVTKENKHVFVLGDFILI